jgi:hypothetical protein
LIRRLAISLLKVCGFLAVLIGFILLWSGLRVSRAIQGGALETPALCLDGRHLQFERLGTTPQRIIDITLTRQVWRYYRNDRERQLEHHVKMMFTDIGWRLFWLPEERRKLYKPIASKMKYCDGALEWIERKSAKKRTEGVFP